MVNQVSRDRFGFNQGRKRPPYSPKDMHCPNCGAGLEIKNENTEFFVCDYCGSHLELSREQLSILTGGPGREWDFPLKLGERFRHKGAQFETIARMAFIEDNDPRYTTREYLLFNPYRGTMYLDEYEGNYTLYWDSHVKTNGHPFTKNRGDVLETHDNRRWVCEETGTYELAYVDGALPWIASVGDEITYAEFVEKSGSGMLFDAQLNRGEIEYSHGQKLSLEMLRRAMGRPDLAAPASTPMDAAQTRSWFFKLMAMALAVLVLEGIGALYCIGAGSKVLEQEFSPSALNGETLSKPFTVSADGNVIQVKLWANLNNAWMAADLAIIEGDDKVVHVFDQDIEYYHGVEGGESWSEGSKSTTSYFKVPKAGQYKLLVHSVSAAGETPQATSALHGLKVSVYDGAMVPYFFFTGLILAAAVLVLLGVYYSKWRNDDED